MMPCCNDPEYIHVKKESSKYIFIRENSLEWNMPVVVMKQGTCCGIDPCIYEIQDNIKVLYFDDPIFSRISDQTRYCNEFQTCLFGGQGERIQIDSPCCFGICHRSSCPCICVPICCPNCLVPCVLNHTIYVRDAQKGKYSIEQARQAAMSNPLYNDELPATELSSITTVLPK